jgi:general secretion pathway protein F
VTEYRCLIVSPEGRSDWRRIDAPSEKAVLASLAADGLVPIDIRSGPMGFWERLNQPVRIGRRLSLADQALILTQMATLVGSGLPVDRSLDLLREQAPRASQRDLLSALHARVRAGGRLSDGLAEAAAFPAYVTGIIRSAERAGRLDAALASIAARLTAAAATRRQLVTALTYPAAVLAATLFALLLVLLLVVPQFEPLFAGNEARLPLLTQAVLASSQAARDGGALALAGAAGLLVATFWIALRRPAIRAAALRVPRLVPGLTLRDQYLTAQFCGLMSTLIDNGVPVLSALQLAREAVGSARWRQALDDAERRVREGASLSQALAAGGVVPTTAVRLIEVGERTGRLAETLAQAGLVLGDSARARIERAVALANPVAIVSLGGLVALLVAGVMLGIFSIGDFAG